MASRTAEPSPAALGPLARQALRRARWSGAAIRTLRTSPAWILGGGILGAYSLPIEWPLSPAIGALGTLALVFGFHWIRKASLRALAVELDRLGSTRDRCATLFEPLPASLDHLIGSQLEDVLAAGISWPALPWRRATLAGLAALLVTVPSSFERSPGEARPGRIIEPDEERAPLVARAASELAGEEGASETGDLAASLDRLARLLEAGSLEASEADRLIEQTRQDLSDRAAELAAAGQDDERIQRALAVLAQRAGTAAMPAGGSKFSEGDGVADQDAPSPVRPPAADTRRNPSAPGDLARASWDARFDPVVRRYFRDR